MKILSKNKMKTRNVVGLHEYGQKTLRSVIHPKMLSQAYHNMCQITAHNIWFKIKDAVKGLFTMSGQCVSCTYLPNKDHENCSRSLFLECFHQ